MHRLRTVVVLERQTKKKHGRFFHNLSLMFIVCGIFLFAVPVYAENPIGTQGDFVATGVQLRSEPEASSSLPANAELKDSQSDSKSDVGTVFNDSIGEGSNNASSTAEQR